MIKLKQIALVAAELDPIREQLFRLLGLDSDFADPGVAEFGLHNTVMAIGDTFLEVVSPMEDGTTAGRLLARRGGDGGYMVISLVDNIEETRQRMERMGIRRIWEIDRPEVTAFHVHPKDIGAAIVSFDEMRPATEWQWAGPGWRERRAENVSAISAVEVQARDPEELANRWSRAFDRPAALIGDGFVMKLDEGEVRILEATDGRGDGVSGVQFDIADRPAIEQAALDLGLGWQNGRLNVCGTQLIFREVP
ncbi:MAG: VOC family protein [Proteobacteria bacterium]|nr:VOC family protein [Pseudomonadota bacterium]